MSNSKISALTSASTPLVGTEVLPIVQSSATVKTSVDSLTTGRTITPLQVDVVNTSVTGILSAASSLYPGGTGDVSASVILKSNNTASWVGTREMVRLDAQGNGADHRFGSLSIKVKAAAADANPTEMMLFDPIRGNTSLKIGDYTVTSGNVVIGTSGKGIDFSATPGTGTSELLADYEEGTFTPTVSGSSTAGAGTYTARNGKYTKIGNTVYFLIDYILSAHTGTGDTLISGLPYAAGAAYYPDIVTIANGLSLTALYYIGGSVIGPGGTFIYFQQMPVGGGSAIGIPIDGTSDVRLSGFYFTS